MNIFLHGAKKQLLREDLGSGNNKWTLLLLTIYQEFKAIFNHCVYHTVAFKWV